MGIESATAAIDFAGLIDEAVRNKNGERSSTPRRRSSMASMSMKLLLPNAPAMPQPPWVHVRGAPAAGA